LGHPSKFQRVSRLAFVIAATSLTGGQPNFARCLVVSCVGILRIHFRALFPLTQFQFTSKSCVLLYWPRYCTALQQRTSAKLRRGTRNGITEISQRAPRIFGWAAITLGVGPHSSFLSTVYWFRSLILLSVHSSTAILSLHAVNEEICSFSTPRIKGSHYTLAFSFANCIAE